MSTALEGLPTRSSATPIVLTRNIIPILAKELDASDLLECYALVRSVPLHGIANSTLHIQKMAIGIRYRPKVSSTGQPVKDPLELTLEYGPLRFGPQLGHDTMPFVEESSSYISWDNIGKVYYTTKIVTENFVSSYYMASMTGAVLEKIMLQAVDYTEKRKFYQPFSIYSLENGREIRSSSSADFTQFMWTHLANLGVEIEPILPPPLYEARLWTSSVKKVIPEPVVSQAAATFYQRLYHCLESIATNDYSAFMPSASPTASPVPTASPSSTIAPTEATNSPTSVVSTKRPVAENGANVRSNGNGNEASNSTEPVGGSEKDNTEEQDDNPDETTKSEGIDDSEALDVPTNDTDGSIEEIDGGSSDGDGDGDGDEALSGEEDGDGEEDANRFRQLRHRLLEDLSQISDGEDTFDDSDNDGNGLSDEGEIDAPTNESFDGENDGIADENFESDELTTSSLDDETASPALPSQADGDGSASGQDVEKANKAAQEAQMAADVAQDAAQSEGDTKAADAAQAAAHAAKAAADATSNAAAQAAMDSILSGDGAMMTSIINTCFTNPQYEIASIDADGILTSEAYLYRDSTRYYKLNLTKPFFEVVKVNRPMPVAVTQNPYGSGGDFIDWFLALSILGMMALAILVICQQMGNVYVESIFKFQRWFFNPRKYDYEGELGPERNEEFTQFVEDGIPLSMGGRRSQGSPVPRRITRSSIATPATGIDIPSLVRPVASPDGSDISGGRNNNIVSGLGHVELTRMSSRHSSGGSTNGDSIVDMEEVSGRLTRHPDLVDFPDLKSSSKVAMPVRSSSNGNHTPRSQYRDDRDDDSNPYMEPLDHFD